MRVHQEEKKYICPKCGYKCKWATQLKYHMTKHTGISETEGVLEARNISIAQHFG